MKPMSEELESFEIITARNKTGCGLNDIIEGMELWPTNDPLLAAYYMEARSHAIVVKGDRDLRDRAFASQRRLMERIK